MMFLESWSSDAALVRASLADRPEAFEALVLRYQRKAHAIARAIGVSMGSVDDVVQESFLQAFCGLRKLSSPASFGPWFLTIVRNLSRKQLERGHVHRSVPLDAQTEPAAEADPSLESEDVRAVSDRLRREVQELPEGLRETIFLYYYEGLSVRRVAQTLEISPSAVKVRLLRGRDLLRERLWRSLEDSLRESLPSPRLWKRKGRKLALFLIASVTLRAGASAATAAAVGTGWLANAATGVLFMSTKKIIFGAVVAFLLVSTAVVLLLTTNPDRPPGEKTEIAGSTPPGAGPAAAATAGQSGNEKGTPAGGAPAAVRRTGVAGTVFREGSPAPEGIRVAALFEGRWGQAAHTVTEKDGTYLISDVGPGRYRLFAWSGLWTTQPPEADRGEVEVRKGELTEGVDLTLIPGAILKGQVVEKSSRSPVPRASVECFFHNAATDDDGRFTLDGLRAGMALLVIRAGGFAREMEQLELALGDENFATIEMVPGGEIEGLVTDAAGKPAPAADVEADWGGTTSANTDPAGRYRIEGIPLTSKDIKVTASLNGTGLVKAAVSAFPDGESKVTLDLQLEKGVALKGQVVDAGDQPVPGAEVRFGENGPRGRRRTDDNGRFAIEGASEKTSYITAGKKGFAPGLISLANLAPEARESLRIVLQPGHFLAGLVTDPKGSPVAGAYLNAFGAAGASSARTDAEGRFRLEDLPSTLRSLSVHMEGFAEGSLENVKTDREDVSIILEAAGQVMGLVVDKTTFSPVHPFRAKLVIKSGPDEGGSIYSTSWRSFDLPDGGFKFTERVKAGERCKVVVSVEDYIEAEVHGVEAWPLAETRDPIRIELEKGGVLNGRVVDGTTGSPLAGAKVRFAAGKGEGEGEMDRQSWPSSESRGPGALQTTQTDGKGNFQLKGLPAGQGALFLEKEGYARRVVPSVGTEFDNQSFELVPAAALEGVVRTEDGKPISEARVEVAVKGMVFPEVTTDKDGHYRIGDLPAGKGEVRMDRRSAEAYMHQKSQTAILIAGETSTADFIESGGFITGRVTNRQGKPIPEARVLVKSTTDIRQPTLQLTVDGDGVFRLGGVIPGIYDVRVEIPGRSVDLPEGAQKKVVVDSGESVCDFSLNPSNPICVVTGRVIDRLTGNPVPGARVELREHRKGYLVCGELKMPDTEWLIYGQAGMGNEESFRIEVYTAGSYLLTASTGKESGLRGWTEPLNLRPSKEPVEVTIEMGGPAALSLTVLDGRSSAALAGCAVTIHPANGIPVEFQAKADGEGKAVLSNLPTGQYKLEADSEGYSLHKEVLAISKGSAERTISLEKNSWIQVIIEGNTEGKLKGKSECYVTAAAVSGGDPGWPYLSKDGTQPAVCGAIKPGTSGQPSARLKARPGKYSVRFEIVDGDSAFHAETQDVEVPEAGADAQVRLTLP